MSVFVDRIMAAIHTAGQMRGDGASQAEVTGAIEEAVRAVWPYTREWHYLCDACRDTGLVLHTCRTGARCSGISSRTDASGERPGKYRRLCALHPTSTYTHEYGVPCACGKGDRFRPKARSHSDELGEVGKTTSRPLTRWGR